MTPSHRTSPIHRKKSGILAGPMLITLVMGIVLASWAAADESAVSDGSSSTEEAAAEVQERGITKDAIRKLPEKTLEQSSPPQAGGDPPAHLCHTETRMMTQCKCFNQTDCQSLTAICAGSCPSGSSSCQCVPLFRGTPPPLPQPLCGYQVPLSVTQCSCQNAAECQLLSPYCPGSCPAGSQSCTCTPLRRGR